MACLEGLHVESLFSGSVIYSIWTDKGLLYQLSGMVVVMIRACFAAQLLGKDAHKRCRISVFHTLCLHFGFVCDT